MCVYSANHCCQFVMFMTIYSNFLVDRFVETHLQVGRNYISKVTVIARLKAAT